MSNTTKGEIGFDAGGERYTLVYSVNALCALEDKLGDGATAIAQQMANPATMKITTARTLFWAGLRDHHGDLTVEDAGAIMDKIGVVAAVGHIAKAMTAAFPAEGGRPLAARPGKPGKRS